MTKQDQKILIYSTNWCPDCKRAKKFFGEHRIPYENIDIEDNPAGMAFVEQVNEGKRIIPTIVFPDGSMLVEPSNAALADKMGLQTKAKRSFYDVIIIGGGPTGLTAAIYLSREGKDTLVIERAGLGGQVGITQVMDNFPGFDQGIAGAEFADRLERQARRFGVEILQAQDVTSIDREEEGYLCVTTWDGSTYGSNAVLVATGAHYKRMGIEGEDELIGVNVHFCATCDGAFYKDKKVLVVGGGNSGFEEGLFLTRFAEQVDIVEFLPQVKASPVLQDKVSSLKNMTVTTNHKVVKLVGDGKLDKVLVEDRATGEIKTWNYDGIFVFIGLEPNNALLKGKADLDRMGFIETGKDLMSSFKGVFAAGDVRSGSTKQAASAAGEGATAALMIRDYLNENG